MKYKIADDIYSLYRDDLKKEINNIIDLDFEGDRVLITHTIKEGYLDLYYKYRNINFNDYIKVKKFCIDNLPYLKKFSMCNNRIRLYFNYNEKHMIIY